MACYGLCVQNVSFLESGATFLTAKLQDNESSFVDVTKGKKSLSSTTYWISPVYIILKGYHTKTGVRNIHVSPSLSRWRCFLTDGRSGDIRLMWPNWLLLQIARTLSQLLHFNTKRHSLLDFRWCSDLMSIWNCDAIHQEIKSISFGNYWASFMWLVLCFAENISVQIKKTDCNVFYVNSLNAAVRGHKNVILFSFNPVFLEIIWCIYVQVNEVTKNRFRRGLDAVQQYLTDGEWTK